MPPLQALLKQRKYSEQGPGPSPSSSLLNITGLGTALTCGPPNTWKVLVVDDYSRRLLEAAYKVFDVLHMNITGESHEYGVPERARRSEGNENGTRISGVAGMRGSSCL